MSLEVHLTHSQKGFQLEASFASRDGITAVFGPSGSGKTTIVNAIAGLIHADQGRITLNGKTLFDRAAGIDLPPRDRRIGYVFQDGRLFPHMDVAGNIRFGARFAPAAHDRAREAEVVELLGLKGLMTRRPGGLSGGEKQRVALARALLSQPDLLLMDEPLAALDGPRKDEILPYLEALRHEAQVPIVYVSHSVAEVARLADHLVILQAGQVVRDGPAEEVLGDPGVLPFVGVREAGAILTVTVAEHHDDGLSRLSTGAGDLVLPGVTAPVGTSLRIRVLAQDLLIALEPPRGLSSRNILPVTIESLHRGEGPGVAVQLRLGSHRLLARITARAADELNLRPGLACHAILKAITVPRSSIGQVSGP